MALASACWTSSGCHYSPLDETQPPPVTAAAPSGSIDTPTENAQLATQPTTPTQPAAPAPVEEPAKPSVPGKQFAPERLKFAMVAVGTPSEGWLAYGVVVDRSSTGFDVITADHVLADRKSIMVQAWQGDEQNSKLQSYLSVTIMHRSPGKDLAWLRVRAADSQVLPLSIAHPEQVDAKPVWTYHLEQHQPVFEQHEIDKSVTAQRNNQATAVAYLRLKGRIEPGLSGGGLIDGKGQWIGIASGNGNNQAHYVAPSEIIGFLKEAGLK